MKITQNTTELLILDHIPWRLSIGLFLLVLVFVAVGMIPLGYSRDPVWLLFSAAFILVSAGIGLAALALFARRLQFIFDATNDNIHIRQRSILGYEEQIHRLSSLIEARLEVHTGEGGHSMHRPVLILQGDGPAKHCVALHEHFSGGAGPEALVNVINRWLAQRPHRLDS